MPNRFGSVQGNNPRRSAFDLSHEYLSTCDMGQLVPILAQECVPGDTFNLGQEVVIRMQPLVAPVLHDIDWTAHTFFVPNRIMMGRNALKYNLDLPEPELGEVFLEKNVPENEVEWEDFIKGGEDGDTDYSLPLWKASTDPAVSRATGSLWDYFGHQIGIATDETGANAAHTPLAFDKRAYNLIWNEYYRDEELQEYVPLDTEELQYRNWRKDYFTIARPEQQRGTSPSFPLSFDPAKLMAFLNSVVVPGQGLNPVMFGTNADSINDPRALMYGAQLAGGTWVEGNAVGIANMKQLFVNLFDNALGDSTVGFDMNDLRTAVQIQRFMELNARAGTRYIEFLKAHFGVAPRDSTLQRPEYVGGCGGPVVISEVLQTSSSNETSPQANMSGHGITASRGHVGKYFCTEYGWLITVLSIMPKPVYEQGIRRQSLRRSRYDFYFPEFAHLSEQAVYNAELCVNSSDPSRSRGVFGFQPIYEEMRVNRNMVTGLMRNDAGPIGTLDFWHVSRQFDPTHPPDLNEDFVSTKGTIRKNIFAYYSSMPEANGFLFRVGHYIKAIRPLPYFGTPGRLDHVGGV